MTVFDQQALDERNVISAADLAEHTPSLNVNTRFGSDQASFSIRGFTQEFRTTASVGIYFADVVYGARLRYNFR
jgi:iron complex outermembrane receptor protein